MTRDPVIYFRAAPGIFDNYGRLKVWKAYWVLGLTDGIWAGAGLADTMGATTAGISQVLMSECVAGLNRGRR